MTVTSYIVLALALFVSAHAAGGWGYEDPSKWVSDHAACGRKSQSPINIITPMSKYAPELDDFKLMGYETPMTHEIVNNGHTIKLNIAYKAAAQKGGLHGTYNAFQLHFHWAANKLDAGSEHVMDGKAFPLELHIVHMNDAYHDVTESLKHEDGLAVLGFFFEIGDRNKAMDKFLGNLPGIKGSDQSEAFSLAELLGSLDDLEDYYRYQGSLTTPPCSEVVTWTVFNKHLTLSKDQLDALWAVKDSHNHTYANYRPLQKLNGRNIYTTIKSSGMMPAAISVLVFLSALLSANLW